MVAGHASAENAPCETLVYQGPCSKFHDCRKECWYNGWKCGGVCQAPRVGIPLDCFCKRWKWLLAIIFILTFYLFCNFILKKININIPWNKFVGKVSRIHIINWKKLLSFLDEQWKLIRLLVDFFGVEEEESLVWKDILFFDM